MKVLRVIASVRPEGGGPIEGLRLSAEAMRSMGYETEIVSLDHPAKAEAAGLPFKVHALGPGMRKLRYTPKLAQWFAAHAGDYDAAVVEGLWHYVSIGGGAGLRRANIPYLLFPHGMMDPWFKQTYPLKHLAKQAYWTLWQGRVLRDAHEVLFTSEEERRLARGAFHGYSYNERVISFGTSGPPDDADRQREAWRAMMPQLAHRRYFLFLSRIHPKKGCDLAITAFAKLAADHPDTDLVIAGPDQVGWGVELKKLAERLGVSDRIHWPGMVSGPAKWGAMRDADVFLLPSHQENFGIVVAEAMACGTPVLITNRVNIWQEVERSGGGLVRQDTAEGVHDLMASWLVLPDEARDEMRRKAVDGFREHFAVGAFARDLDAALQRAAAAGPSKVQRP